MHAETAFHLTRVDPPLVEDPHGRPELYDYFGGQFEWCWAVPLLHRALAARVDEPIWVADVVLEAAGIVDETEGPHEDEDAKLAEFKRFLEEVDPEDFQG